MKQVAMATRMMVRGLVLYAMGQEVIKRMVGLHLAFQAAMAFWDRGLGMALALAHHQHQRLTMAQVVVEGSLEVQPILMVAGRCVVEVLVVDQATALEKSY